MLARVLVGAGSGDEAVETAPPQQIPVGRKSEVAVQDSLAQLFRELLHGLSR